MVTRLDSSLSCLRFLAYASSSYSSPVTLTRLSPGLRYAQSSTCRFVSHTLTRLDNISVLYSFSFYARLYLYLPDLYKYWVGDGTIPIFNLLCNHPKGATCEIPRTLLVLSSSLAKAIRFACLREFPSVYLLTGSKVQPM